MRLSLCPGYVYWVHKVPVLEAVLDDASVKWVMEFSLHRLEMSVAVIVCLLVGRHVSQNHRELQQQEGVYNLLEHAKVLVHGDASR